MMQPKAKSLPGPEDRPGAAVVVYDGKCRFCVAQVERLSRWDCSQRLAYKSLHDADISEWLPGFSREQLLQQMYVVEPNGKSHGGAAAFRYMTRVLPRLWVLAPLLHIPGSLRVWQWLYRQVAKRRYLLGGLASSSCDDDTCHVHFK